jgi:hypothetical protein
MLPFTDSSAWDRPGALSNPFQGDGRGASWSADPHGLLPGAMDHRSGDRGARAAAGAASTASQRVATGAASTASKRAATGTVCTASQRAAAGADSTARRRATPAQGGMAGAAGS